jgi:hypothetical protein
MKRSKDKRARIGAERSVEQRQVAWALAERYFWEEERSELESGVAERSSTVPRTMPDDQFFAVLAELAQVPATSIERLRSGISYELSFRWGSNSEPPAVVPGGSKKRALIQLRRAAKFSRELSTILLNLDQKALGTLGYVDNQRRNRARAEERQRNFARDHPGEKLVGPNPPQPYFPEWGPYFDNFQKVTNELTGLLSEAQSCLEAKPRPNPQGRPRRGAFSLHLSGSLVEFTLRLLLDVRAAGGRLSVDKNLGGGTLLDALNLLRPYLPRGFIPRKLPVGTLDRVRTLDRKLALEPSPGLPF